MDNGYHCFTDISRQWGMYSPYFRVASEIPDVVPAGCRVTFVNLLQRHGSRYPDAGKGANYQDVLAEIKAASGGANFSGAYAFLANYTYTLGTEDLTRFGQQQSYNSGLQFFSRYKDLARKHTPFVRASGAGRVYVTALNWTAGFHDAKAAAGVHSAAANPFPLGVLPVSEAEGQNNTLDPSTCPLYLNGWPAETSDDAQDAWRDTYIKPIRTRINDQLGTDLSKSDIMRLMDMCPMVTVASPNGAQLSPFCGLFTTEEWGYYDYYKTVGKFYGDAWGNYLGAAQGIGYVNELVARLTNAPAVRDHTTTNTTLDADSTTFPVDEAHYPIFADFSHDDPMTSIFAALGLYNATGMLSNSTAMPADGPGNGYSAAWATPFAARAYIEKQQCTSPCRASRDPIEYVRILVNGRVIPLQNCGADKYGRCKLDAFIDSLSWARSGGNWDACYE